jgi:hypothetical protein
MKSEVRSQKSEVRLFLKLIVHISYFIAQTSDFIRQTSYFRLPLTIPPDFLRYPIMKVAHVIICHQNPAFVARLINRMEHDCFDFYVHVDKKTTQEDFSPLSNIPQTKLIEKRVAVHWGGYSCLIAILNSIETILNSNEQYEFVNILTGQDYPLKSADHIYNYLAANKGKSFLRYETPPSAWWDDAFQRFTKYHMTNYHLKGKTRIEQLLNLLLPERKFPLDYTLYGGAYSAHWTISMGAAKYFYEFLNGNKKISNFFKHTWGSDEFLTASIIINSPFKDTVVNNNFRYIDWSFGGSRPKILTVMDLPHLIQTPSFFARKFDPTLDADILDIIDRELIYKETKKEKLTKAI